MQIQRIQTLWLFLALGCMIAFLLLPFGQTEQIGAFTDSETVNRISRSVGMMVYNYLGLLIPVGLAILLLAIALLSWKDLQFQRSVANLSLMMELVSIGITVYILCDLPVPVGHLKWHWASGFVVGALVFTILAIIGISHDRRLLRSYDRIR